MVFNARLDAKLVALNQRPVRSSGKQLSTSRANGAAMTLAPQYVTTSSRGGGGSDCWRTGGEYGARGHLDAYAAATGKLLWRFWSTDPATYAGNSWQTGGAPVWGTPTFDPTLNMVYFSTGNADPVTIGTMTAGHSRGNEPILGQYRSARRNERGIAVVLPRGPPRFVGLRWPATDSAIHFEGIPAIEHTNKAGYTFILDRASGEPLIPIEEVAVPPTPADAAFQLPWPTQPESTLNPWSSTIAEPGTLAPGEIAAPMWTTLGPTPQVFAPIASGGMEWPPAAYSPRTGLLLLACQVQSE